ncbi:MAG: sigma-70 family RNA polymerase sigma factor [Acidobacteriota bacterium]|nr:MAG: sigma-70 family RNA polymerase sigma factor [Acidobacteriota bacterium]
MISRGPHRDPPFEASADAELGAQSTHRLMRLVGEGDEEALEELCRRYLPRLQRWARGRLPAAARSLIDTEDLVQDVLVQTIHRLSRFECQHINAFQAYVRKALDNRIRNQLRHTRRSPGRADWADDPESAHRSPLDELVGQEIMQRYEAALSRLRPSEREAIVARLEIGGSWSEMADALDKPSREAARKAVVRAVARLAEEMARDS